MIADVGIYNVGKYCSGVSGKRPEARKQVRHLLRRNK